MLHARILIFNRNVESFAGALVAQLPALSDGNYAQHVNRPAHTIYHQRSHTPHTFYLYTTAATASYSPLKQIKTLHPNATRHVRCSRWLQRTVTVFCRRRSRILRSHAPCYRRFNKSTLVRSVWKMPEKNRVHQPSRHHRHCASSPRS